MKYLITMLMLSTFMLAGVNKKECEEAYEKGFVFAVSLAMEAEAQRFSPIAHLSVILFRIDKVCGVSEKEAIKEIERRFVKELKELGAITSDDILKGNFE